MSPTATRLSEYQLSGLSAVARLDLKIHEFINDDPRYRYEGGSPKVSNLRVVRDRFNLTLHVFGTKAVRELIDLLLECESVKVDP